MLWQVAVNVARGAYHGELFWIHVFSSPDIGTGKAVGAMVLTCEDTEPSYAVITTLFA